MARARGEDTSTAEMSVLDRWSAVEQRSKWRWRCGVDFRQAVTTDHTTGKTLRASGGSTCKAQEHREAGGRLLACGGLLEAPERAVSHRFDIREVSRRCGWQHDGGGGWRPGVALPFEPMCLSL